MHLYFCRTLKFERLHQNLMRKSSLYESQELKVRLVSNASLVAAMVDRDMVIVGPCTLSYTGLEKAVASSDAVLLF
jgi:hypothetical protein